MEVILSFCGDCGSLLYVSTYPCLNCNHDASLREDRLEGIFPEEDAKKLFKMHFDEELSA